MTKYKKQYQEMVENNEELFMEFKKAHDAFAQDPEENKEQFAKLRSKILVIIRKNEDKLCAKSERTKFASFSGGLADKFWEEIKSHFPHINDSVLD